MAPRLPAAHAAFVERLIAATHADARLLGVAAAGSYVTDELDDYSDLDFQVVVADDAYPAVMADRMGFAGGLGDLLVGFTGEHVGEPRLLICLYGGPTLHVDFKFMTGAAFATDRVEDPVVLWERDGALTPLILANPRAYPPFDPQGVEDRFWVWVHYGAGKVGRGELFEADGTLAFMRDLALAPLAKAIAGRPPRGSRFLEREAAAYLDGFRAATACELTPAALVNGLRGAVALYRRLRDDHAHPGLVRREAAEAAAVAALDALG